MATASAAALAASRAARGQGSGKRPNILFVMVDDLGYGDLGCYGQTKIKTPHLDQMAAEGIRFTNAYSGCTVCEPARSTLMTGFHVGHASVRGNTGGLPLRPEDVTVAELLKQRGYHTALIGKWGLGEAWTPGDPNKQGFDYYFGYLHQVHAHYYYTDHLWRNGQRVPLPGNDGKKGTQYTHDELTKDAVKFLRAQKGAARPFCLFLTWTVPHGPMVVPDLGPYAKEKWAPNLKKYAAMIHRLDTDVGKVMALLKELGLDDDTLVFFTSDNGAERQFHSFFKSNGPLRGVKRDFYEGGIRVPFVARWPGRIEPGSESDHPCAFWDVLPTFVELAGGAPPKKTDGISIVPTLLGRPDQQKKHEYLYWEWRLYNWRKRQPMHLKQAVRLGHWKGVRLAEDKPLELYDLATDIGEKENVAAQHPDVVKRIEGILKTARTPDPPLPPDKWDPKREG